MRTISRQRLRLLVLAVLLAGNTSFALSAEPAERSLAEIERALDPLEFIANHDGVRVSIDLNIAFAFDSDRLLPAAEPQIEALGQALAGERLAEYRFEVIGHTDGVGGTAYNHALSIRRAERVRQVLIDGYEIAPERLVAIGKGDSEPKPGLPKDAAAHRRVEIRTLPEADTDADDGSRDSDSSAPEDTPIDW